MDLNKLKDEMLSLRKNTGEATDQKNTWATKYEALERNFKQVSMRSCLSHAWERDELVGACESATMRSKTRRYHAISQLSLFHSLLLLSGVRFLPCSR